MLDGVTYAARGDAFDRNRVTIGGGADLELRENLKFGVEYHIEAGANQNSQRLNLTGNYKF